MTMRIDFPNLPTPTLPPVVVTPPTYTYNPGSIVPGNTVLAPPPSNTTTFPGPLTNPGPGTTSTTSAGSNLGWFIAGAGAVAALGYYYFSRPKRRSRRRR